MINILFNNFHLILSLNFLFFDDLLYLFHVYSILKSIIYLYMYHFICEFHYRIIAKLIFIKYGNTTSPICFLIILHFMLFIYFIEIHNHNFEFFYDRAILVERRMVTIATQMQTYRSTI